VITDYLRYWIGGALALLAFVLKMKASLTFQRILDEVNGRLPESARIPEVGMSFHRSTAIRAHRQFFPTSILRKRLYQWWTVSVAFGLLALVCLIRFR
jgi:hypothetical protein